MLFSLANLASENYLHLVTLHCLNFAFVSICCYFYRPGHAITCKGLNLKEQFYRFDFDGPVFFELTAK